MAEAAILCRLDELPDGEAKGFSIGRGVAQRELFIVRKGACVFVYENACPHTGATLDWQPDVFLDIDKKLIQCATHGALFRIEDGYCVHGPCIGGHLSALPARIEGGFVYIEP